MRMKVTVFKFIGLLIFIAGLCLAYGFFVEPRFLKTRHVTVKTQLSAPIKIGLISDIHIGGFHMPPERVMKIVANVMAQQPDVILLAGDYVNGHDRRADQSDAFNAQIEKGIGALSGLSAPQGVYAAMGNHDSWYGQSYLSASLTQAGVRVLINDAVNIDGLCVVGLADADTGVEDKAAFNECEKASKIVALMHSPDSFQYLRSDTALAVAGHTHGGQINLPFLGRFVTSTRLGKPYAYGLKKWNGIPTYISAGLGTSILPARFRAPPETVIIHLVPQ